MKSENRAGLTKEKESTDSVKKWMKLAKKAETGRQCGNARAVAGTCLEFERRVCQPSDEVLIAVQEWDEHMKDTFHAEPAEALGPQHAGALLQTIEYAKKQQHSGGRRRTQRSVETGREKPTAWRKLHTIYSNQHSAKGSTPRRSAHHQLYPSTKAPKDASRKTLQYVQLNR